MPKPSNPPGFESVPVCDLCGSFSQHHRYSAKDLNQHKPGNFEIVQCNSCGLVFLNPRPDVSSIGSYYPNDYWRPLPDRNEIYRAYGEIYDELAKLPPGRMLDVGTGGAYFLSLFEGWQREGTELSPQTAERSAQAYGFPVHSGLLEDVVKAGKIARHSFDLITLNHVIEHLYSPRATVKLIHELLKPGGKLMISTPNIKSVSARLTGPNWYHLDPPRHLYLFSPRLLTRLLTENGFRVDHISYRHREHNQAGYTISFRRLFDDKPPLIKKLAHKLIHLTQRSLPSLMAATKSADVMAVFATKID